VIGVTARVAQRANISLSVHVRHVSPLLSNVSTSVVPLTDPRLAADPFVAALGEVDPKVVAIVKDYYRSFEEWRYLLQDVSTPEKHREVMEQHPGREYMDKLISLAEEQRRTPLAFQALLVAHREVARSSPESQVGGSVKRGLALLAEDHVDDERLAPLLILLTSLPTEDTRAFIRTSIERSPHGYCQAVGCYALGQCLAQLPETKEVNDELVGLLERVEAEFADAKYGGTSLIESAKALLYQRKHLGVGRAAPEIESDDVDGGTFKLSDFRGRVVLLDFWGDWCPYCVKMYPQNRLLVEKLKDRPFTLLGVNTDDAARLRRVVDAKKVTWKSWADGPLPGPIATRYQIEGVPTMYVIDGQGVIRFKFGGVVEGPALEEAVESLLAEVEAGSETAPPASDAPTEPATPDAP
jgi:peroxiredoxin